MRSKGMVRWLMARGGAGHRPFLFIADQLTRRGFAVIRYDDRGTNQSTGDFRNSTILDLATDAEAAIGCLQGRAEILKHLDTAWRRKDEEDRSGNLAATMSLHAEPLRRALAHNNQASVRVLPGLNHLFQTAETGSDVHGQWLDTRPR